MSLQTQPYWLKLALQPTESANLRSSLRTFGANIASEEIKHRAEWELEILSISCYVGGAVLTWLSNPVENRAFQEKRFPWIPQQHKRAQQAFEAQRGTLQNSWWDVPPSSANLNPDSSLDLKRAILQTRFQTWPIKFKLKNLTVFRYVFWKFFSIYPLPCRREVNILFTHFLLFSTIWYWTSCETILLYALMDPLKTIPNFSPTMVIQYSNHRYCTSSWRTAVGTTEDRGRLPGTTKLA